MAIADGDPRVLAPDLLARLTSLERRQVVRFFGIRLAVVGRGQRLNPDHESRASVAREAIMLGVLSTGLLVVTLPLVAFALSLSSASYEGGRGWWIATTLLGAFVLVCTVLSGIRYRQVNRYFTERFPDSLDRWFFKPGFETTSGLEAGTREPTPTQAIEMGNPQTFAPDLLARLTSLERAQITRAWAERLARVGSGKKKYPDDQPAVSVARQTILQGVLATALLAASALLGVIGYCLLMFFYASSAGGLIVSAVLAVVLIGIWLLFRWRRRTVLDYFTERHPGFF